MAACSPPGHERPNAKPPAPSPPAASASAAKIVHSADPLVEAQSFFAHHPATPRADGSILVEGEELHVDQGAWSARPYGTNYYASTFANCFLSRMAYLGAPEQSERSTASVEIEVPKAGRYLALARYEAAYRFHTQFRLIVEQKGKTKLDRLYGARDNLRVYAFGKGLQKEVAWGWGATETIVWEGHDAFVDLEPGVARVTLVADHQPEPAARRNVDALLFTADVDEVTSRIAKEPYLPLDGLLTQEGDVYLRVHNHGDTIARITLPPGTEHSPYWVHKRTWKKKELEVQPGNRTEWIEVGSLLDTLNDGQWAIGAKSKSALHYDLEFAVRDAAGALEPIRTLADNASETTTVAYFGNTRHLRRLIPADDVLYNLVAALEADPVRGKRLSSTLFFGYTFERHPKDPKYEAARTSFLELMGATALDGDDPRHLTSAETPPRGFIDVREIATPKLAEYAGKLQAEGKAAHVGIVSLGDEIGLATPKSGDDKSFVAWLKSQKIDAKELDPASKGKLEAIHWSVSSETKRDHPYLYHQSKIWSYRFGIQKLTERTKLLTQYFPNAGVGANYSPHGTHQYLGQTHQWISLFREGGMTMPWGEDYIFMSPVGSPQVNMLTVDTLRAGVRGNPKSKIHYYVMAHSPNNTPDAWRRQFFGDIGHGVKIFDLFEFRPVQAAYTENYVNSIDMYREVRKSIHELGTFEDMVQEGAVDPGVAGIFFSETADVWDDHDSPFDADERALYLALRHRQVPLDMILEGDPLQSWSVIYLTDRHVSRAASKALQQFVEQGGKLVAIAGAGMFDERNQPNLVLRKLFGVQPAELEIDKANLVHFEKQDLPFAEPMDHAKLESGSLPVLSARQRFSADSSATVLATFDDGSPAAIARKVGKGTVRYLGFLPGLAYLKPAIPRKPPDRSPAPDSMVHLLPTAVDPLVTPLLWFDDVALPATVSAPFVEASMVSSPKGLLVSLVNWSTTPRAKLQLTLAKPAPGATATLASGKPVTASADRRSFELDLDVADVLILR